MNAPRNPWALTPEEIEASASPSAPQASGFPPVTEADTRPLAVPHGRGAPGAAPITQADPGLLEMETADDIFAAIRRGFGG